MSRLNQRAYDLLVAEIYRLSNHDPMLQVQRDLVLKRLLRLRQQAGAPATAVELRAAIVDLFPNFDPQRIQRAARLNQPSPSWMQNLTQVCRWGAIATGMMGGLAGLVWVANLPYPMVRWPVAKAAPILLLPSFMEMDHHYRQTIALVEQSDQLINQATGPKDIELGKTKVKAAQASLDKLPVWFLGYFPQRYCTVFSCSWQFTLDEFKQARAQVGRMEAKVFQEEQALQQLETATANVENAKGLYATIPSKQEAIALWQTAVDQLNQIPPKTLAGRLAQPQISAVQRDFQQQVNTVTAQGTTQTQIVTARAYAQVAVETVQNPPHPSEVWEKAADHWRLAIAELQRIPPQSPGYIEAQTLKAQYEGHLGTVKIRLTQEQEAQKAFQQAQEDYVRLLENNAPNHPQYRAQLQRILNSLATIKPGTTVYGEAIAMLKQVQTLLRQVS